MLRHVPRAAALLAGAIGVSCIAAPLDDALRAYESGDYVGSIPLIRQWANAGDPRAQYNLGAMYFARSDSGARYQRAVMHAMREALLERSEVFVRAFVRIANELHEHPHA